MIKGYLKKFRKKVHEQNGFTLVELLASLALLSIVTLLIGSVHIFGQRQFRNQRENMVLNNEIRDAITLITTDIRSHANDGENISIDYSENNSNDDETGTLDGNTVILTVVDNQYQLRGNTLRQNERILSDKIGNFTLDYEVDSDGAFEWLYIELVSTPNANNQVKERETTLYFRRSR